jgi:Linalool dehydratase/isomerase
MMNRPGDVCADAPSALNDRSLGWLRFLWDKATTVDDWSDQGLPHQWWDRYSEPPMCAFPRFDLAMMGYVLPMMLETTPAWRECYTRILDELIARYTSFWGAIDWNTLIGPDPGVDKYPPEWLMVVPEHLRGRYALPGWTGNGVEPWGLQPDPVGCDGNLFYRGWLNLLLGLRHYVSGEPVHQQPFEVSGYQNRQFTWTHERMARFLAAQLTARPQGAHCENTKIWPFCMSAAGLGLQLYDSLLDANVHSPFVDWIAFAKKHYMGRDRRGRIEWVAFYYDPIEDATMTFPGPVNAYSALCLLHYIYPQDAQLGIDLYESAMRQLGWNNSRVPVVQLADDPQMLSIALWMARELGDTTTWDRLREVAEIEFRPTFFGDDDSRFGYFPRPGERWPRGQLNATMMMIECAPAGAWSRVFTSPNTTMYREPTVRDVEYPLIGIRRTHHDTASGSLTIDTFAATPSRRGDPTSFSVDTLPAAPNLAVEIDGDRSQRWRRTAPGAVAIYTDIDTHRITVAYR